MTNFHAQGANAYRNVGLQTQSPQQDPYQLVVMMFDATLECLNRARGAIIEGEVHVKVDNISKAVRIIQEGLRTSLDMEQGGELAGNLANLYDYCVMRLTQANAANSVELLEEVTDLIKPVADAWKQLRPGAKSEQTSATPASAEVLTPKKQAASTRRNMAGMYGQGLTLAGA